MLFSSLSFLYFFLPAVLILYFIVPTKVKNIILLISSLVFYFYGEALYIVIMLTAALCGYLGGILIDRTSSKRIKKLILTGTCVISLGMLVFFKYTDFFISNINALGASIKLLKLALPLGISFYTFQILSYDVDVYRGNVKAQYNPADFFAYVTFFPQLIAGPIVRYGDVARELESRTHSLADIAHGIQRFTIGLSKKILIANVLAEYVSIYKMSDEKSLIFAWTYAIAYMLHIYFDFSAYSDMAIGLGRIFGFKFPENFNYPYISRSATEFWRRWHMTLGSFFRDYVYIPLGGNRVSKARWIFNIFVVWTLTGFWHGAEWNFALWGVYFAVLLVIEKTFILKYLNKYRVLSHIYTIIMVGISFVIFDSIGLSGVKEGLSNIFGISGLPFITFETIYNLKSFAVIILIAVIGATPLPKLALSKIAENKTAERILEIVKPIVIVFLLVLSTAYLVDGSFNPFIYFRF